MIKASDIISRVRTVINDTRTEYRNTDVEMFGWITDCLNVILTIHPNLFRKTGSIDLVLGANQSVSGIQGAVAFAAIPGYPKADLAALDAFSPGWMQGNAGVLQNWSPGVGTPDSFLVYPPSPAGQSVLVDYIATPTPIASLNDQVAIPDNMVAPVVQYCVGMVESKDDEHVNSNRAAQAKAEFIAQINGA